MTLNKENIVSSQKTYDEIDELINNCLLGDKNSFGVLVKHYQKYVSAIVFRILWDEDEVKDVVQETFIKVWKNISRYKNEIKFSTWIYKIAVNCTIDRMRKIKTTRKYFANTTDTNLDFTTSLTENSFLEEFDKKEMIETIKNLSYKLSQTQRLVFTLIDLGKMNIAETAEILNITPNTVKANLSYARKNIRLKIIEIQNWGVKNEMR